MMMDIVKNEIYINKLINVVHGYMLKRVNPIRPEGRKSDGFIFILKGCCLYTFDDGTVFTAKEGNILYLAKGARYRMDVKDEKYEFIYFDFEFSQEAQKRSSTYPMKNPTEIKNLFFRLKNNYESCKHISYLMTDAYKIYSLVCECDKGAYLSPSARSGLDSAVKYINEHLSDDNLCVNDISRIMNISEVYLRKLFNAKFSCSPNKYITESRLEKARLMLDSKVFTIEETAIQCGFKTPSYFSNVFKKHLGITPREYKNGDAK